jgi:photosystem II stability/assembly factor-like uncharacterized protein
MKHVILLALVMAACGQEVSLENRPCPCIRGWTCETGSNLCVRNGGPDPGAGDAGQDARSQGQGLDASPEAQDAPSGQHGFTVAQIAVGDSTIEALHFSDDQHGFLAASDGGSRGLYVTADGGATWQPRELDVAPYGVAASPSVTTVLAAGSGTRAVWSSRDRGASFAPVPWTLGGWPAALRFLDEQTVFMGDEVGDSVFRSADAGQTWSVHLFTREVLPGTHHLEALGSRHAWIVGGPSSSRDGTGATIAYSSDAAQTWTIANLTDNAHLFKGGSLRGIAVVSPAEIWVAGVNRQVFHTTNGMATWTQIKGIPAEIQDFGGVAVRGNTIVLAGSSASSVYIVYRSTDGGATFQIIDRRASGGSEAADVHGVTQTSGGNLFVYGFGGRLWKYTGVMLGGS